ncbi:MAG: glutathione S-transferase [Acidocella sp. 20-63-7]|nr:MAG: glutathione S-transferase [Acidocella sp. 20-63-7]
MITVHHLENSRSQRVLWLLEELGVPYEVKRYERDKATMLAPPALRAVHPLGKSPVITDSESTFAEGSASRAIAETGAIVEYLIETYGEGRLIPPPASEDRQRYRYWLHYAEGSAMPPLVMKLIFSAIPKSKQLPFFIKPVARTLMAGVVKSYLDPEIARHVGFWAEALAQAPYFAGAELTGADIMMSFPVEAAAVRGALPEVVKRYLAGLQARPAYQRALARGGPYRLMEG